MQPASQPDSREMPYDDWRAAQWEKFLDGADTSCPSWRRLLVVVRELHGRCTPSPRALTAAFHLAVSYLIGAEQTAVYRGQPAGGDAGGTGTATLDVLARLMFTAEADAVRLSPYELFPALYAAADVLLREDAAVHQERNPQFQALIGMVVTAYVSVIVKSYGYQVTAWRGQATEASSWRLSRQATDWSTKAEPVDVDVGGERGAVWLRTVYVMALHATSYIVALLDDHLVPLDFGRLVYSYAVRRSN